MDKQYSVKFFSTLVESIQRLCREFVEFDQAVEISGYLSVEIDNFKKERYVLSEMLQNSGNVISESYCTKAFKTHSKCCSEKRALRERQSNATDFGSSNATSRHNVQANTHQPSQSRPLVLADYGRTSSNRMSSLSSGSRHVMQALSNTDCSIENHADGYGIKNLVSVSPSTEESRNASSASNNLTSDRLSEEERGTKRVSSFSSSTLSKREKIVYPIEQSIPSSTQDNPLASFSEGSYTDVLTDNARTEMADSLYSQPGPSANTRTSATDNLYSQSCSSTEESVRLPMFVKEEQDDLVLVGSSEEDSNNMNMFDAGDASFLMDSAQNNHETTDVNLHRQSAAYTESACPGDQPKGMAPAIGFSPLEQSFEEVGSEPNKDVDEDITKFTCPICGKKFKTRSGFRRHYMQHMNRYSFVCDICNKGFNQRSTYEGHVNVHNKFKPFKCGKCGKSFAYRGSRRRHALLCMIQTS